MVPGVRAIAARELRGPDPPPARPLAPALAKALELLQRHDGFLISSHVSPDGDAIGSALALLLLLRKWGKGAWVALQDPIPPEYHILPHVSSIQSAAPDSDCRTAVVVDCENLKRTGSLAPALERCEPILVIDHHISETPFGDVEVRDTSAAACAEIVFHLVQAAGGMDPEIAQCLMAGLILDTGNFRFPNVTPTTLRVAADLVEAGALIPPLYQSIYENHSFSATKLLGLALSSLTSVAGGRINYAVLTRRDFEAAGAQDSETNGIVNQVLSVAGTLVAVLLRESADGDIRVSLRSRGCADMNRVAKAFGGGGHQKAAGCTLPPPLEDALQKVLAEILKQESALELREDDPDR